MSAPSQAGGAPIEDRRQLIEYFEAACKPPSEWRLGTEHEKFVFRLDDHSPVGYTGEDGIGAFLQGLERFGWQPVVENGNTVALASNGCHITLEPGGQLELAGEPLFTIHEACQEVHDHLKQVKAVAADLGLGMLGLGFTPQDRREDMPWMPKARYDIMRAYMPTRGNLGLDMMLRSATVQVNLDYGDEAHMVKKL
ncbi:MAG: glutamate-cysteine ligase family protein, partial [Salinisphaera sp.]|nr:glutamate-cysteine ligase family protein [Salinisphaera sp.]